MTNEYIYNLKVIVLCIVFTTFAATICAFINELIMTALLCGLAIVMLFLCMVYIIKEDE